MAIYTLQEEKRNDSSFQWKNINPIDIEFQIQGKTNLIQEIVVLEWKGVLTAAIYPNFQAIRDEKL